MRRLRTAAAGCAAMLLLLAGAAGAQTPTESVWQAASGFTPDQVCPAWTLEDTASADPSLGAGVLTLSTAANAEDMFYLQTLDTVPDPLVIEFRTRFVSGSSSAANRGPIALVVTTAADTGTMLFLDQDSILLIGDGDVVADSATSDTDGAAHTYRVEITAAGAVSVLYDGTPLLSGTTWSTVAPDFGDTPRILWGEGAGNAFGASAWESFAHNGTTCPGGTTTTSTTAPAPTTSLPPTTTTTATAAPTTSTSTTAAPATTTSTTDAPGATTTSTTDAPGATTTSTTLPAAGCDEVPPGSLAALRCRIERLRDRVESANDLDRLRDKLLTSLGRALDRAALAAAACEAAETKTARRRVKQARRQLGKTARRLRSLAARRRLDPALRAELLEAVQSMKADAGLLRRNPCDT